MVNKPYMDPMGSKKQKHLYDVDGNVWDFGAVPYNCGINSLEVYTAFSYNHESGKSLEIWKVTTIPTHQSSYSQMMSKGCPIIFSA